MVNCAGAVADLACRPGRNLKQLGKKTGAPRWQDDCINVDKGGRCPQGTSQSKRTCTSQALTRDYMHPFNFTVKWDLFGFYITGERKGFGCPNHTDHRNKGDLSKLFLPTQLIPEKEKHFPIYVGCMHWSDGWA
jgi:hypothetical protein